MPLNQTPAKTIQNNKHKNFPIVAITLFLLTLSTFVISYNNAYALERSSTSSQNENIEKDTFPYFVREPQILWDFSEEALQIADRVQGTHPRFLLEGKVPADFFSARERYLEIAKNITHTDFVLETQRFLATLNDGHLSRTFLQRYGDKVIMFQDGYFTAQKFLARGDKLYLKDEAERITDAEVVSIGGVSVSHIFAFLDEYYGAYNHTGILNTRGKYAGYELVIRKTGGRIGYDSVPFVELVYKQNEQKYERRLEMIDYHPSSYRLPNFVPEYYMRYEMIGDVMLICMPAQLTQNSQLDETEAAIKEAIDNGIWKFILDLRNTPGGHTHVGDRLLRAMGLTPPKYGKYLRMSEHNRNPTTIEYYLGLRYFRHLTIDCLMKNDLIYVAPNKAVASNPHNVVVVALTSPFTFSGATTLAVEVADGGFGPIIGEPPSTPPSGYGYGRSFWVMHNRVQIRPHVSYYIRPDTLADQKTLWPDIQVNAWEALEVALEYMKTITTDSKKR